ncbi:hypothetical protein [Nocardia sp. IFM 10818]
MGTRTRDEWLRDFAVLALRINRHATETSGGTLLIYSGPGEWERRVREEALPAAEQLADDCAGLREELPFEGRRAKYLSAQLRSMRAVAERLAGERLPLTEYGSRCLGVEVGWSPEDELTAAQERLEAALPPGSGSPAERLHEWQQAHALPSTRGDLLPALVDSAVAETIERTAALVPLPDGIAVDCAMSPGPHRGHYAGGRRGTLYINDSVPFNLADLFHVVAHEGFPGHIAESMLKDVHLAGEQHQLEHRVRFMISPSFVISEGIGLHAQGLIFPADTAQAWITDNVLVPQGMSPADSDFAGIHRARDALWGAWANAALLADAGRPDGEIADYLLRWALLTEAEAKWALDFLRTPGMDTYVLAYHYGRRLVGNRLDHPDRQARARRLLTEPLLPSDLVAEA